jgi:hypothetical protein
MPTCKRESVQFFIRSDVMPISYCKIHLITMPLEKLNSLNLLQSVPKWTLVSKDEFWIAKIMQE